MEVPMLRPPHVVVPPPAVDAPSMAAYGQSGRVWQQGGRERSISELAGAWRNVDMPGESYEVRGLKVIRTDARGIREFSLHWDSHVRRWRWGPRGRLLLTWVADDAIAWVPEQAYGAKDSRAWRWERCISSSAASSSYEPWRQSRRQERQRSSTTRRIRRSWSRQRSRRNHSRERSRRHRGHSSRGRRRSGQSHERHHHSSRWIAEANALLPCGLTQRELHDLLFREIRPEDYDLLCRLDAAVKPMDGGAAAAKVADAVENLPTLSEDAIKDESCSVCLTPFEAGDAVPELPCNHYFHRACLARWLSERPGRPTCPLCCKEVLEA